MKNILDRLLAYCIR